MKSIWGITAAFTLASSSAMAGNGILGEWTNNYSLSGCGGPNLSHNDSNVGAFLNNMPAGSGVTWPIWANWGDNNAWDKDLIDSDKVSGADDNVAFDPTGAAIAMYSGHGTCSDFNLIGTCAAGNANMTCNAPKPGGYQQSSPVACTKGPNRTNGTCIYFSAKSASTCSSNDFAAHQAVYTTGNVRFGESANSGSWAGAGTNGGINFAILDVSCGVRPGLEAAQLWNAFAGVHNIATVMPTTYDSDTFDDGARGLNFARTWRANNNSSITSGWLSNINNDPFGRSCNGTSAGYGGIAGCGANWVASVAQTQGIAQLLNGSETWVQAQNDATDPVGASYMAWTYICNYNCFVDPITI